MGQHLFIKNPTKTIQNALQDIGYSVTSFRDGEDEGLLTVMPVEDLNYVKSGLEQIADLHLLSDSKQPSTEGVLRAVVLDKEQIVEESNLRSAANLAALISPQVSFDSSRISDYRAIYSSRLRELSNLLRSEVVEDDPLQSLKERFADEFEYIVKHPQVKGIVDVGSYSFSVLTTELTCSHPVTRQTHRIGEFRITISFLPGRDAPEQSQTVLWQNLSRRIDGYQFAMHAPHVFPEGVACLGNMRQAYRTLVSQGEYYAAVCEAIRFIESVNIKDSAGRHLENWPTV
jgi:hypothetical protein